MSDLYQPVLEAMDELNHRVREVQFTRGILGVIAVAIGVLLSLMLIDLIFSPPERWMQFALSAAGLAIVLFFVWRWLYRPGRKQLKPLEIARHLETVHPELEERLSSAIELSRHPDPGVSQSMVKSVVHGALADVEKIDPDQEITSRSVRPFRNAAFLVGALMLIIFAVQPSKSFRLAGRTLMPWMDIGNVWSSGMKIEPGDLVALRGTPIDLTMQMEVQRRPPPVFLERSGPDGTRSRERMPQLQLLHTSQSANTSGLVQHFALHIPEADESFRYRIACGRRLSAWHDIEVVDRPSAEQLNVDVEWPAYTGLGRVTETNELVSAVVGSIIHVELVPNKEIGQFGLWYGDPERAERLTESTRLLARWSFELTPEHAGPITLRMRDRHGFEGEATRMFDPVPDGAPTVDLLLPLESKLRLRSDASLHLGAYVEDDSGVAGMEIVVEGAGEPLRIPIADAFAASAVPGEPASFDIGAVLKLRDLDLSKTQAIKVWLEAWDISPDEQRGRSRPVFIGIDKDADSQLAQEIERQAARAREELDKAMRAVQDAKAAAKKGSPLEVAERAREADAETRELAEALSESMMNQLGEEARETADAFTEPAVQDAERVPLTDSQEQENALRQQVAQNMSEAENALEEMKKDLAELQEQLQQLADIKELADRERGIADAAGALESGSESAEQPSGEQPGGEQAGSEPSAEASAANNGNKPSDQFDPLQAQQADATSQIGEAMQKDDAAMAGQRQAAAQRSAELAQATGELAAIQETLQQAAASGREGAADGSKAGTQDSPAGTEGSGSDGTEALRDALQDAIGAQQQALAAEAASVEAADAGKPSEGAPSGEGAQPSGEQTGKPGTEGNPNPAGAEAGSTSDPTNPSGEQAGSEENAEASGGDNPNGSPSGASGEGEPMPNGQANGEGEPGNNNGQDPPGASPSGSPTPDAAQAATEAAEQMAAGDLDAARAAAVQAAAALENSNAPGSDELAERQQQLAEQMDALAAGDLQEALAKTRETMAEQAAELAEQAKSFAAAEAAAGQDAQAGQALEAGQQLAAAADAEQQAAQGSQDGSGTGEGEPSQEQMDAEQTAAEQLRAALESLQALAQQAAEQAASDQAGAASGENPLADALESAAQASTTDSPADMQQGASEAADALDLAAQQAQQKLGLSKGIPGLPQAGRSEGMPVPMPGQPSGEPGSQPGSQQPGQAGGKPGQMAKNKGEGQQEGEAGEGDSPEGGGAPEHDFSAVPPALEKLGVSASDWSRLRGQVDSRTGRTRTDGVPAEYRDLVERYFESIASER